MSKFEKPINVKLVISKPRTVKDLSWRGMVNWRAFKKAWGSILDAELGKTVVWLDESGQTDLLDEYLKMVLIDLVEFHKKVKNGDFEEASED